MSGIEDFLLQEGYFYFVVSHRHRADLIDEYPRLFVERSVDGLIAVDTPWSLSLSVPVVTVSGHNKVNGVTNIVLNHVLAAESRLNISRNLATGRSRSSRDRNSAPTPRFDGRTSRRRRGVFGFRFRRR